MQVFGRADEGRIFGLLLCALRDGGLARVGTLGNEGKRAGACDAVGRRHPFLHVLVGRVQVVGHVVIVAQIHGSALGTPEVSRQEGRVVRGAVHLQRGGIALPEVLDADAESTADIACEDVAVSTFSCMSANPLVVGMGALVDGVTLIVGL